MMPEQITHHLRRANELAGGQKAIPVIGPVPELKARLLALHASFWKQPKTG